MMLAATSEPSSSKRPRIEMNSDGAPAEDLPSYSPPRDLSPTPRPQVGIFFNQNDHSPDFVDAIRKLLDNSLAQYKKDFKRLQRLKATSDKLRSQKAAGEIPHACRVACPKLVISSASVQTSLDATVLAATVAYHSALQTAFIQAHSDLVQEAEAVLSKSSDVFIARLREINLHVDVSSCTDQIQDSSWLFDELDFVCTQATTAWYAGISCFRANHNLGTAVRDKALHERNQARDQAMADADVLPTEPTIAELVRKEVQKQLSHSRKKTSLSPTRPKQHQRARSSSPNHKRRQQRGRSPARRVSKTQPTSRGTSANAKVTSSKANSSKQQGNGQQRNGTARTRFAASRSSSPSKSALRSQTRSGSGQQKSGQNQQQKLKKKVTWADPSRRELASSSGGR